MRNVVWFEDVNLDNIREVGGKNTSLGEMIRDLSQIGVEVPQGFSTTASAFRYFLDYNNLRQFIDSEILSLDLHDLETLSRVSLNIKNAILSGRFPPDMEQEITNFYSILSEKYPPQDFSVAVRSSATAEDLESASFAGQQETFLNIKGIQNVLLAIKGVFASLYTPRALSYRATMGILDPKIAIAAGIQQMVRTDIGVSGVMFTLDTESGFRDVILINSSYGFGEAIVQGIINPDEFFVHKPMLLKGTQNPIIKRSLGSKEFKIISSKKSTLGATTRTVRVPNKFRHQFSLSDEDIITLSKQALTIEKHYGKPMDIEWGKDGLTGKLYILQARPETVKSQVAPNKIETYKLKETSEILITGLAIGQKIGKGTVISIQTPSEILGFEEGHILVTRTTDPSWEPIMKKASAIITDKGGRTCHAAILARELGIPTIVGCGNATEVLKSGMDITVSCAEGNIGHIYSGLLKHEVITTYLDKLPSCPVKIYMNVGNPNAAFQLQFLPNFGVGLARIEFIISSMIRFHPNLALTYPNIPPHLKRMVEQIITGYPDPKTFYIDKLSEGIATIAAAFWPKPVIVRLSDFKTDEYRELIGGNLYEPLEKNPMIGWRGASRYITSSFSKCFAMECMALRHVREKIGLVNVELMIPFVRTVRECKKVIELLATHGLKRGENGLRLIMMCEIPSNALLAEYFLHFVDGYSIGSNDMTQLTLGIDRDSEILEASFDERDPATKALFKMAIEACKSANKSIGICGQAPSDYLDFAEWLVHEGITSLSLNPDSIIKTWMALAQREISQKSFS